MAKKKGGKKKSSEEEGGDNAVMTEEELKEISYANLRKMAKGLGYSGKNLKKDEYIQYILDNQGEGDRSGEEEGLSDAVAEVIGDKDDDDKKKVPKKYKTALLKYQQTDGLDTSSLEELVETGSLKEIKKGFKEFEESLEKIDKLKEEFKSMDIEGLDNEKQELEELLTNPGNFDEAEKKLDELKFKHKAASIREELEKMVLPAMKERVNQMKARLDDMEDLDKIEGDMKDLRRDYKEAYAEEGVMAHVADAPAKPAASAPDTKGKKKIPMVVKDIFLLYKDGRFISHHTNRVVSKDQQKVLFADLKTGRNFLRSPKYVPQKLNVIPVDKRHILVQSGKFTVVIMITEGSVDPWTERIITKVLTLMEKEDAMELRAWNGEVSSLKSSGKYMQALLFACMKLSKKGKA